MMFSRVLSTRIVSTLCFVQSCFLVGFSPVTSHASVKERYDVLYLKTSDLGRILDYKEELEDIFDQDVQKKLKVVGRGKEFALIYDGNDSAKTVARTLIRHAEILGNAGYDEPYAVKDQEFHPLFNVSYGFGPHLEPLKKKYELLYRLLDDTVKNNLFIEQTASGNYVLVYRLRGDQREAAVIAKRQARILRSKKIKTSLARENNNQVVYGESSLMDDAGDKNEIADRLPDTTFVSMTNVGPIRIIDQPDTLKAIQSVKKSLPIKMQAQQKIVAVRPVQKIIIDDNQQKVVRATSVSQPKMVVKNNHVERSIEDLIDQMRQTGRISSDEMTGWMVYDLEEDKSLVDINADLDFQAASMIKPFVALAYFQQVKAGKLKYSPQARRYLEAMIQRSSNSATNWVMKQAGGPTICDSLLKRTYSRIFRATDIEEYIPPGGKTYKNSASPADYVRFLRALWNEELPYGKEIRRLMALPGRDRLYYGTPIPKGTLVYNKTGTTARLCGDMGILVPRTKGGGRHAYAIVGIIERRSKAGDYGSWMHSRSKVIRDISTLVYQELKKDYRLM